MLKRISSKKTYKVEFFKNGTSIAVVEGSGYRSMSDTIRHVSELDKLPNEVRITDPDTNEFVVYSITVSLYNPHEQVKNDID